jgi:hypothetical protein
VHFCFQPYYSFTLLLYFALSYYSCTCWVSIISILNLAIFFFYSNLLLRSWRRFGVLRYGVLGERLLPVDCLWSYVVFPLLCFNSVRLSLLLKILFHNKYYILWHWLLCIYFLYDMWENLIPETHTMLIWFGLKIECDKSIPGQGMILSGLTGGEIMYVHDYRDEGVC